MLRIAENLLGLSGFDDAACVHHDDPVAQVSDHTQVVADDDRRSAVVDGSSTE